MFFCLAPVQCLLILSCVGCNHVSSRVAVVSEEPEVVLVDIGDVPPDFEIEKVIKVSNNLDLARGVKSLSADCGCIENRLSSSVLEPNGSAELFVKYKSPTVRGQFSHRVFLRFVDGGSKVFAIEGTVGAWFSVSVPSIDFGRIGRGDTSKREIVVSVREGAVRSRPVCELKLKNAVVVSEDHQKDRIVIELAFSPNENSEFEENSGELLIRWAEPSKSIRVPCSGEVCRDWVALPGRVFWGVVTGGEGKPVESDVTLKCIREVEKADFSKFRIEHNLGSCLTAELSPRLENIKIRLNAASLPKGRIAGEVIFYDSLEKVLVIPVEGFVD